MSDSSSSTGKKGTHSATMYSDFVPVYPTIPMDKHQCDIDDEEQNAPSFTLRARVLPGVRVFGSDTNSCRDDQCHSDDDDQVQDSEYFRVLSDSLHTRAVRALCTNDRSKTGQSKYPTT